MKKLIIKESTLRKVIRKYIKEVSFSGAATKTAKRRGGKVPISRATTDKRHVFQVKQTTAHQSKADYDDAKAHQVDTAADYQSHQADNPGEYDTSQWIHPQTSQTHTLGQGETQPAKGWSYRQRTDQTVSDTSKWIHPYSKVTTTLSKGQAQPAKGWEYATEPRTGYTSPYEPSLKQKGEFRTYALGGKDIAPTHGWKIDSKGPLGQTTYHHGTVKQHAQTILKPGQTKSIAKPVTFQYGPKSKVYGQGGDKQYGILKFRSDQGKGVWTGPLGRQSGLSAASATTNPTTTQTSYATQYGQGSTSDYTAAQRQAGRDQWAVGDTTNPSNPDYADWATKNTKLKSAADVAAAKATRTQNVWNINLTKAQDAHDEFKASKASDAKMHGRKSTDKPTAGKTGGAAAYHTGTTAGKGGRGSVKSGGLKKGSGRKGKGRGKGKKGKKGKKEESLIMRNNVISEAIKPKKSTVNEIKKWMKTLEENRYRKIVQADARRVAWFVNNNLAEDYESMPKSIVKKWSKAAYGRERYLAKEYLKHKRNEQKKLKVGG